MIEDIIQDPKVIGAAGVIVTVVVDVVTGAVKNSKMARQSWVLRGLARLGLAVARRWNER